MLYVLLFFGFFLHDFVTRNLNLLLLLLSNESSGLHLFVLTLLFVVIVLLSSCSFHIVLRLSW